MQNNKPIFTLTPFIGAKVMTVNNSNRDGTGTLYTCLQAGTNGSRIHQIKAKGEFGTSLQGMLRLFIDDGSTIKLWREEKIPSTTDGPTIKTWETSIDLFKEGNLVLPYGSSLKASKDNTAYLHIIVFGAHY